VGYHPTLSALSVEKGLGRYTGRMLDILLQVGRSGRGSCWCSSRWFCVGVGVGVGVGAGLVQALWKSH
jgi:hypothetical protein